MMRVLQVLPRMLRGGSQTMVMNLYRNIDRNAIQFDFIVFTETENYDFEDEIRKLGGKIYSCPKFKGYNFIPFMHWWRLFFIEHPEYKLLHSHVRSFACLYLFVAKRHNVTTIIHSHSTSEGIGIKAYAKRLLEYSLRYQADYLFACSGKAGQWLFGSKKDFRVLPNGIELNQFTSIQHEKHDGVIIGHVGRFYRPKNHVFLIKIFSEFLKYSPTSKLLLVGDGPLRSDISRLCDKLGISENVQFVGRQDDVKPYYAKMDVFLFPSSHEGFPVSVIEAQASGIPCLISDTITNEVCLTSFVKMKSLNDSPEDWACEMLKILSNKKNLTVSEKNNLLKFDSKNVAKELATFYSGCVKGEPK